MAPPPGAQPASMAQETVAQETAAIVEAAPQQKGLSREMVQQVVTDAVKQIVGGDEDISGDVALMDAGMDSLSALSFRQGLAQQTGLKLPSSFVFDYPTLKEVTNRIVEISQE